MFKRKRVETCCETSSAPDGDRVPRGSSALSRSQGWPARPIAGTMNRAELRLLVAMVLAYPSEPLVGRLWPEQLEGSHSPA